jgi:CheY-like chemotaxis protein
MQSIRDYQRRHNMTSVLTENRHHQLKVLLVEDDEVARDMMRDFCARCDMPIDCTAMASGLEALIDISSIMPDILVADLNMPGVDGFELLRTLRQNPSFNRMTYLVVSALTAQEIESRGGLPEGTIFVPKPVNLQWLNGFFTALMASRHGD